MTTFDDRENAFEAKFAHDAEMQFKAEARRNKLLGSGPRASWARPATRRPTMPARSSRPTFRKKATRTCSAR
jgi:hypothetical protein